MLEFAGFPIRRTALKKKLEAIRSGTAPGHDKLVVAYEAAERFREAPSPESAGAFSEAVFRWGGPRPYGKLKRDLDRWNQHVHDWLTGPKDVPIRERIGRGLYPGLGVSYASKHLRVLEPAAFGVLDSVMETYLGYACNPVGYERFTLDLRAFQKAQGLDASIGEIEQAIYHLIQDYRYDARSAGA